MNTSRKGTAGELRVADWLQKRGWLVGSRRHIPGPGDLLAHKPGFTPQLIEVKATRNPWQQFRRPERAALLETAKKFQCEPLLALSPTEGIPTIIPSKDWPNG